MLPTASDEAKTRETSEPAGPKTTPFRLQLDSPLLRLPAELRNKIYTLVLEESYYLTESAIDKTCTNDIRKRLALTAVSRQVYKETRLLPFEIECFCYDSPTKFSHFLDRTSTVQRSCIRELLVYLVCNKKLGDDYDISWDVKLGEPLSEKELCFRETLPGLRKIKLAIRKDLDGDAVDVDRVVEKVRDFEAAVRAWNMARVEVEVTVFGEWSDADYQRFETTAEEILWIRWSRYVDTE